MKAVSLIQPYAQLIVDGRKLYETRTWQPKPWEWQKPLAIHASRQWGIPEQYFAGSCGYDVEAMPLGAIVGIAQIRTCLGTDVLKSLPPGEMALGDFSSGRFAWRMEMILKLDEPIRCSGALQLWDVPTIIEGRLLDALQAVPR